MFQLYDIHGPIEAICEETAVTVGVFDGVHRGHQALIHQLSSLPTHHSPVIVTLTSHPSFVLGRRQSEYWLDDAREHLRLLFDAGARYVAVLPFTQEVAQLPACKMARMLYDKLMMRSLLLGYDSRFGSKQNDDFEHLPQLAREMGFSLHVGEPYLVDGEPISSSRIRESLLKGNIEETCTLLGRHYCITGTVLHGRGVGHTIGFPTANVDLSQTRKMLPREGVYAVRMNGIGGIANLGTAPTYSIVQPMLEVHLPDFEGDLYGKEVSVAFLHRLRDIVRFDTPDALVAQLRQDLISAQQWI